eukprot:Skav236266  [mRNA]  locus=scaffold2289:21206:46077:+ [translate_table: standard]
MFSVLGSRKSEHRTVVTLSQGNMGILAASAGWEGGWAAPVKPSNEEPKDLLCWLNARRRCSLELVDGHSLQGFSFGATTSVSGEVVFNTGMVAYPESLTDPSYAGQILVITYPLVGNYGVPSDEKDELNLPKWFESHKIHLKGVVISDYSYEPSHYSCIRSLGEWLASQGVPGIYGVDTRQLGLDEMVTKLIRQSGSMLGKLVVQGSKTSRDLALDDPNLRNLAAEVSRKEKDIYSPAEDELNNSKRQVHVLAVDCGIKNNIIRYLVNKLGLRVTVVPWDYDFTQDDFDGLFLSNGPGDPMQCAKTVEHVKYVMKHRPKTPIFGICLGNQILALAAGASTYKMKFGNRGMNQPVVDLRTQRCYITSQNHGFAVDQRTLPEPWSGATRIIQSICQESWMPLMVNANDGTNEGIIHSSKPWFSAPGNGGFLAGVMSVLINPNIATVQTSAGTQIDAIMKTEDRDLFSKVVEACGEKIAESACCDSVGDAVTAAEQIGYPVLVRAAYALGGLGSGTLVDGYGGKGWKELEYEVVRDKNDNCITVCNMENFDPMGVHTGGSRSGIAAGESIVIAPSQTLTNSEYYRSLEAPTVQLRSCALKIIRHLGIVGECNIQYAVDPKSSEFRIIEVNARLSRSSALASKATGYPLAYVAAKLALGHDLVQLRSTGWNSVTRCTTACFEPSLDYCVAKAGFENHQVELNGNVAIAMGNYYFTSAADGSKTKVEYTFGYKKTRNGKLRIFLHHSSVPFSTQPESVSMEEVKAAQKSWADAIKKISKTYLDGGDYVAAAANAAGELYGYGHGNVLFKPTKAKDVQFRPEASQAMSYFVGAKAVKQADGIAEDGGFAINGGQGWPEVLGFLASFENHQVELNGNVAIAMGNYYFTSAADGSKTKVEYTFGYKKTQDGKVRIFLHHSSVPFNAEASEAKTALKQEVTNTSSLVGTIGSRIAGS